MMPSQGFIDGSFPTSIIATSRSNPAARIKTARIPVFLLTGFLGSGKTTLLNAALRSPALANSAVVVNELGEIGLDNLIVAQASDDVVLLGGGCLCCASTGALHETLADLAGRRARGEIPGFERVIIETSGVADPAPLLNVLLGHPLVIGSYALAATVCVVDAQHFVASRALHPELDKQAALADRIVISKRDVADPGPALRHLQELNPEADLLEAVAEIFSANARTRKTIRSLATLGPIRPHGRAGSIRAFCFRPRAPVTWAGWSAWSRLVAGEFGPRLLRVKGLLRMDDTGEIALLQGVQGVFHPPQRFGEWPGGENAADRGNRLVCIGRELEEEKLKATLPALDAQAGTQAVYSMRDLQERQAQQ
jgi:G3E family GTPase